MLIQNQDTSKDNKRHTLRIFNEDFAKIKALQNEYGAKFEHIVHFLIQNLEARCDKGQNKVEKKIKEWLILGYGQKITASSLKRAGGGTFDYNTIKKVILKFKEEIELHNSKFKEDEKEK